MHVNIRRLLLSRRIIFAAGVAQSLREATRVAKETQDLREVSVQQMFKISSNSEETWSAYFGLHCL